MPCSNRTSIVILMAIAALLYFSACQKDNNITPTHTTTASTTDTISIDTVCIDTTPINWSNFEKKFYGVSKELFQDPATLDVVEYDVVYQMHRQDSNILFLGRLFPVKSAHQTTFTSTSGNAELEFFNDYDSIHYRSWFTYYGTSYQHNSLSFKGSITTLPETTDQLAPGLEGDYLLTTINQSSASGIDTQYVATRFITKQNSFYPIQQYDFHSYWESTEEYYPYDSYSTSRLTWTAGYLSYIRSGTSTVDTFFYSCTGPKQ